jgi:hypothetical protein
MKQYRMSIVPAIAIFVSSAALGDEPITGEALRLASAAALQHTGGGRVTETEVGDEEGYYEVEVTLADGRQVDVHLDADFRVISSEAEGEPDDDSGEAGDDDAGDDDALDD